MIKIIVDNNNDAFYGLGIQTLMSNLFREVFNKGVILTSDINKNDISQADVIIMGLSPGENFVCHPVLYARKRNSLIVGIFDSAQSSHVDALPLCFENIIFIHRTEPIARVVKKILKGWDQLCNKTHSTTPWSCHDCEHKTLSPQQIKVATHYYNGASAEQIAHILNISPKTVFTHKRMIMGKFNVHSDYELFSLLNVMKSLKNNAHDFLVNHRK